MPQALKDPKDQAGPNLHLLPKAWMRRKCLFLGSPCPQSSWALRQTVLREPLAGGGGSSAALSILEEAKAAHDAPGAKWAPQA